MNLANFFVLECRTLSKLYFTLSLKIFEPMSAITPCYMFNRVFQIILWIEDSSDFLPKQWLNRHHQALHRFPFEKVEFLLRSCLLYCVTCSLGVFNLISWLLVSREIGDSWSLIAGFSWRENDGPEIHSWGPLNRVVSLMKHLDWDYKLNISMPRCGGGDNKYESKQQFSCLSS